MVTKLKISQMPAVEVLTKDLIIDVEQDGDKLREFRLSKGSVDFYAKGANTSPSQGVLEKACLPYSRSRREEKLTPVSR